LNHLTHLQGNYRRYAEKQDIHCSCCSTWKKWDDFNSCRLSKNKAKCRKCHTEYCYHHIMQKKMKLFPKRYTECDECCWIYPSHLSECSRCKKMEAPCPTPNIAKSLSVAPEKK
jgi:hypothetical protein